MSTCCPVCESDNVHWLLQRVYGRGRTRVSARSLRWGCRGCGHGWSVPIHETEQPIAPHEQPIA